MMSSRTTIRRGMSQLARPTNLKPRYEHYINGKFTAPLGGKYFDNISPVDGKKFNEHARGCEKDVAAATKAAKEAFKTWSKTSVAHRSGILNKIADRLEANLQHLAIVETIDNGKAVRETMAADLPLSIDHFRYFASVIRAEEGTVAEIDENTVSMNIQEPIGVCGQIVPWNFPLLMASWKIAPALAAGNTVVLKPAEVSYPSFATLILVRIFGAMPCTRSPSELGVLPALSSFFFLLSQANAHFNHGSDGADWRPAPSRRTQRGDRFRRRGRRGALSQQGHQQAGLHRRNVHGQDCDEGGGG